MLVLQTSLKKGISLKHVNEIIVFSNLKQSHKSLNKLEPECISLSNRFTTRNNLKLYSIIFIILSNFEGSKLIFCIFDMARSNRGFGVQKKMHRPICNHGSFMMQTKTSYSNYYFIQILSISLGMYYVYIYIYINRNQYIQ